MRPRLEDKACFLCAPEADLIYASNTSAFALCGLGPIVPGYSLVATTRHTASAADAIAESSELPEFAEQIREILASRHGNCFVTEHGRVPVCFDPSGTSDPHCYHAHFLLFPGVPDIVKAAKPYFAQIREANALKGALELAQQEKEYFLISPSPTEAYIMSRPGRLIRQFARVLVADATGNRDLANWRKYPNRESCVSTAKSLRDLLSGGSAA
jgi:hypothetical protein